MKIDIDMHEVVEALSKAVPRQRNAETIARGLATAILTEWRNIAQGELGSTSRDYVDGLSKVPEEIAPGHLVITLNGQLPNMLEQGWDGPIDMVSTIIPNAKTKHTSAEGYQFVHVPFKHGGPGGGGENVGAPLPKPIHAVAQHLVPKISQHGMKPFHQRPGGRDLVLQPGMSHVNSKRVSKAAQNYLKTKSQPWHTTSVYAGMVRSSAAYEKGTQDSPFSTFRTITTNPDAKGDARKWIHPGLNARNFGRKASERMTKHMNTITERALRADE